MSGSHSFPPMAGQMYWKSIYFRAVTQAGIKAGHWLMKSALNFITNVIKITSDMMIIRRCGGFHQVEGVNIVEFHMLSR